MSTAPILICYDGTDEARHAIESAGALLGPRRAIVLDIAPIVTVSESVAVTSPVVPAAAFMELNEDDAKARAAEGTAIARRAGFRADPRSELSQPTWEAIVAVADDLDAA